MKINVLVALLGSASSIKQMPGLTGTQNGGSSVTHGKTTAPAVICTATVGCSDTTSCCGTIKVTPTSTTATPTAQTVCIPSGTKASGAVTLFSNAMIIGIATTKAFAMDACPAAAPSAPAAPAYICTATVGCSNTTSCCGTVKASPAGTNATNGAQTVCVPSGTKASQAVTVPAGLLPGIVGTTAFAMDTCPAAAHLGDSGDSGTKHQVQECKTPHHPNDSPSIAASRLGCRPPMLADWIAVDSLGEVCMWACVEEQHGDSGNSGDSGAGNHNMNSCPTGYQTELIQLAGGPKATTCKQTKGGPKPGWGHQCPVGTHPRQHYGGGGPPTVVCVVNDVACPLPAGSPPCPSGQHHQQMIGYGRCLWMGCGPDS